MGIGGDPLNGTSFIDILELFEKDEETKTILMIGEIGGHAEEEAASWIQQRCTKPVVAFIAGQTAPSGKRMGHAGAIISGNQGTAEAKIAALRSAGVKVAATSAEMGLAVQDILKNSYPSCAFRSEFE